jgi:hypothetical protein
VPSGATPPTYSVNGTNAAQNITATFYAAGSYTFQVTITDSGGLTATSSVTVTVNQTLTSIAVTPGSTSLADGGSQQFTATAKDQFGKAMSTQPAAAEGRRTISCQSRRVENHRAGMERGIAASEGRGGGQIKKHGSQHVAWDQRASRCRVFEIDVQVGAGLVKSSQRRQGKAIRLFTSHRADTSANEPSPGRKNARHWASESPSPTVRAGLPDTDGAVGSASSQFGNK